ncbi:MAG: excinuclease ABC subunit UvrA [Armatimonadota bacterium]
MRTSILIRGARENNLKGFDLEIPRDQLVVLTGLSGSGKSSIAFDTLHAEAQRRFLDSLSSFARRFIQHQRKPKVDAIQGLSPVVSIEQKTITANPRSTVATMTDIGDYLRTWMATCGEARCLRCDHPVPTRNTAQIAEMVLGLPAGTVVEVCAPIARPHGEDWEYTVTQARTRGCRAAYHGEARVDLADDVPWEADHDGPVDAVVDRFTVDPRIAKALATAIDDAAKVGDGYVRIRVADARLEARFRTAHGCPEHGLLLHEPGSWFYSFNEAESACITCSGLGTSLVVHPPLLVPDTARSIAGGAFINEAIRWDKNTHNGRMLWTLSQEYGFSIDTPFRDLPESVRDVLFHGNDGKALVLQLPPGARDDRSIGKPFVWQGIVPQIEGWYRWYRRKTDASAGTEEWLKKVMVEHVCPGCHGARLRPSRLRTHLPGATELDIHALAKLPLGELRPLLAALPAPTRNPAAAESIRKELLGRLDLLNEIGLDYLSLDRKAATLSGGESQRIRLSTQIASELMGMLYVLDEPSIGLHPKDNERLIATLRRLRDIGNTVIVVEHDTATLRAAEHLIEIGTGPGIHGGNIVAQGTFDDLCAHPESVTGAFLSGRREIPLPARRRAPGEHRMVVRGARANNLRGVDVSFPLGVLVAVTGASGSGKSTLVDDILLKALWARHHDSRTLPGEHDAVEGIEHTGGVVAIDQSPIGRTPRSNPATYVGFYDDIRKLFAATPEAVSRGYDASRFSFNVKGGRCEECAGEGTITTQLNFMPDVESVCPACKGARYNPETLEVVWNGRSIADVLAMSIEEGCRAFAGEKRIASRLKVLDELGLGYLTLGHPATLLSGGEAQRVKLASELAKVKKGARTVYILDEPTTGLHLADIERLLECLHRLVEVGNTVIVIEHHLDVIKCADWVVDLGPEGGRRGGNVLVAGTPEAVAACGDSHTGRFLAPLLRGGA